MTKTFVTGEVLTAADTNTFLVNNGFQFVGTRYYTSSGTFAKADPFGDSSFDGAKMRAIRVRMVGGGGGGGGAAVTGGSQVTVGVSGAGALFAERFILASALPTSVTVTRGGGGAGNSGSVAGSGGTGGTSSFGLGESFQVFTEGGVGGSVGFPNSVPMRQVGAPGKKADGSNTAGDLTLDGGAGGTSVNIVATSVELPVGGSSAFGPATATSRGTGTGSAGTTPSTPGCGGGAAGQAQNQSSTKNGGSGAAGIVIIDVFA